MSLHCRCRPHFRLSSRLREEQAGTTTEKGREWGKEGRARGVRVRDGNGGVRWWSCWCWVAAAAVGGGCQCRCPWRAQWFQEAVLLGWTSSSPSCPQGLCAWVGVGRRGVRRARPKWFQRADLESDASCGLLGLAAGPKAKPNHARQTRRRLPCAAPSHKDDVDPAVWLRVCVRWVLLILGVS